MKGNVLSDSGSMTLKWNDVYAIPALDQNWHCLGWSMNFLSRILTNFLLFVCTMFVCVNTPLRHFFLCEVQTSIFVGNLKHCLRKMFAFLIIKFKNSSFVVELECGTIFWLRRCCGNKK